MKKRGSKTILGIAIVIFFVVENKAQNCLVSVKDGLGAIAPLILNPNTQISEFSYPPITNEKKLVVPARQSVRLACPNGKFVAPANNIGYSLATCVNRDQFVLSAPIPAVQLSFKAITCTENPKFTMRPIANGQCSGGVPYEAGYSFSNGITNEFVRVYDLCHDAAKANTLYSHGIIRAIINASPGGAATRSSSFTKGPLFGAISPNAAYNVDVQIRTIGLWLQYGATSQRWITRRGEYYFAKGHLIANGDLFYLAEQRSSNFYANVVPMWQTINNGNWFKMEKSVRNLASTRRIDLDVYVGGIETLQLEDAHGIDRNVYLHIDQNGNGFMPVPKILFKVVYHRPTQAGVVFLTANNPYLHFPDPEYVICNNISSQINYVTWDYTEGNKGYSYCCEINDFRNAYRHLPPFTTTRLLV